MKNILILLAIAFSLSSCYKTQKTEPAKHEILTTVKELNNYFDVQLDTSPHLETASIIKYIDGSFDLNYEYENMESTEYLPLFYSINIKKVNSEKDAEKMFGILKKTMLVTNKEVGLGEEEINSLDIDTDQCYYALRTEGDDYNGIIFMIRKKDRIYSMIMSGMYTSDHSLINDLVLPKVYDLENFKLLD